MSKKNIESQILTAIRKVATGLQSSEQVNIHDINEKLDIVYEGLVQLGVEELSPATLSGLMKELKDIDQKCTYMFIQIFKLNDIKEFIVADIGGEGELGYAD